MRSKQSSALVGVMPIFCAVCHFLLMIIPGSLLAAEAPDALFASSNTMDIRLEGPFSLIDSERDKQKRYDGKLSYRSASGDMVSIDVNYEVRGNWRLRKQNCRYAQLWVDLKKSQTGGTLFENQNRLKLVVQCSSHRSYEEFLLKEQLAYDLFAAFSEYYFDTRLVNVNYVDPEKPRSERTNLGFFIEHQNRLSDRFQMAEVKENTVGDEALDPLQANLLALFMYLIGNTDYSIIQGPVDEACCHNSKLLRDDNGVLFGFPFDFDNSGFVSASYAAGPSPNIDIRSTKERVYRGYCTHLDSLEQALAIAKRTESAVKTVVNDSSLLRDRVKRTSLKYIDEFYKIINNPADVQEELYENCRN